MTVSELQVFYSYFYKKVLKREPSFSDKTDKTMLSFCRQMDKIYGESISSDWLFDYLTFQFEKFTGDKVKMQVQMNWVFGKKAIAKWQQRNVDHVDHFLSLFREKHNLKRSDLIKAVTNVSDEYKSRERNRFKDRFMRVVHCTELNLFDETHADCKYCFMKNKCKNINDAKGRV